MQWIAINESDTIVGASQVVLEPACQCRRCNRHGFNPWTGKDPLEEGMATHSSTHAWRMP